MAVLLFAIGRLRLWTAALAVVLAGLFAMSVFALVSDEHLGPAVRAELGMSYVASAYGSAVLCVVAAVAAVVSALRVRQGRSDSA